MLKLCKQYEVPIVLGSDSHIDSAVGKFPLAEAVIRETEFPEELIVSILCSEIKILFAAILIIFIYFMNLMC